MAKKALSKTRSSKPWAALNLRVSLFFNAQDLKSPEPLWQKLFKNHPQNQVTKPSEFSLTEQGTFKCSANVDDPDAMLQIASNPQRADFLVSSIIDAATFSEGTFPTIGQYASNTQKFVDAAKAWANLQDREIGRVAYGAILALVVENRAKAYQALNDLLPSVEVANDENVTDFSYTINRRRKSAVMSDCLINRLSTWRSMQQHILIKFPNDSQKKSEKNFVFLELDINTHAMDHLKIEKASELIDELQSLAIEIAEHGEIP